MQDRTALMVGGIGPSSQIQQVLHNQGLVGSCSHQERRLQSQEQSACKAPCFPWPTQEPWSQEFRLPLPSSLAVWAPSPHLALVFTNV
jgi:hypothetical protein